MNKLMISALISFACLYGPHFSFAQLYSPNGTTTSTTNPSTGRVGIGMATPQTKLDIGDVRFDAISNFPAEGSVLEGQFGNYIIGDANSSQRLRFGVSNDGYTRSEIFLDNSNRPDGTISFRTINGNGGAQTRMFIDGTGNVGIGTTTPGLTAHIIGVRGFPANSGSSQTGVLRLEGAGSNGVLDFSVNGGLGASLQVTNQTDFSQKYSLILNPNGGNVGIGTTSPGGKLHIDGSTYVGNENGDGLYRVSLGASGGDYGSIGYGYKYSTTANSHTYSVTDYASQLRFDGGGFSFFTAPTGSAGSTVGFSRAMTIFQNGNVGIGSSAPDAKLAVKGTVHASEVKVDLSVPGPDYVFEKDYPLTSLEDIKTYIDQNRHLPEVPSAKEMEKNGVQLGEMNMLLLKKIEELTLYIIAQENRIKQLENNRKQ